MNLRPLILPLACSAVLSIIGIGCSKSNNNSISPGTTDSYGIYNQQQGSITLKKFIGGRDLDPERIRFRPVVARLRQHLLCN